MLRSSRPRGSWSRDNRKGARVARERRGQSLWQELAEWFIDQSTVPGASEAFKEAGAALATVMDKHFGARG